MVPIVYSYYINTNMREWGGATLDGHVTLTTFNLSKKNKLENCAKYPIPKKLHTALYMYTHSYVRICRRSRGARLVYCADEELGERGGRRRRKLPGTSGSDD